MPSRNSTNAAPLAIFIGFICIGRYRTVLPQDITDLSRPKRMRELFDEVAGHSPLDPGEAVRKTSRTPPRKRFYKEVGVGDADGGFTVTLDGKPIKTPSGKVVLVPKRAIADAIAAEWAAQGET